MNINNNIPLLYQCTNLTSGLLQYNQNINSIQSQLQKDTQDLQLQITGVHQKFEELTFKITSLIDSVVDTEKAILTKKANQTIQAR